jgi:tetratricopeptide (TPR) repeat protein
MFGYAYALRAEPLAVGSPEHGHNFVVHTAVELGLLGVLAYSALTLIVAWTLLRMLLAVKRGSAPLWLGYLVIGLSSVLAGRTLEQMGGKAQIADILLSWVLIGVVVTLAALFASGNANELSPPLATNEAKPETGQRRRRGARRAERRRRSSNTALRPFHIAGAVVVALAALVFWSQTIFPHVRSAITLANGQDASDQGRPAEAFLLLQKSVEQSPSSAFAHLTLGAGLRSGAKTEPDAETQRIALERAYAEVRAIINRNPLDGRAWNLAAQIGRDQALIATGVRDQLITDSETLVQLLPSRWEPRLQLAQARGMFGEHALALEAVQEAKALGGTSGKDVGFLFFLEATALRALGRIEEANVVIEQLAGLPDATAQGLLLQLTGGAGQ